MEDWHRWAGRKVTVLGVGAHGGNVAAINYLVKAGARVSVSDLKTEAELGSSLEQLPLEDLDRYEFGCHSDELITSAELVVASPAIPPKAPPLMLAASAQVPVTTEIVLFWQVNPAPVIGVSGSNGKSTTVTLLDAILKADGITSHLGGNIGRSLLPELDRITSDDWVILELSSFQLDWLNRDFVSPEVAVLTNCTPNHLNWHSDLGEYHAAKQTLLRWQKQGQCAVLNRDCPTVSTWRNNGTRIEFGSMEGRASKDAAEDVGASILRSGSSAVWSCGALTESYPLTRWLTDSDGKLKSCGPGASNALAAIAAAKCVGVHATSIEQGLRSFQPLPHRMQFVGEVAGRRFIDDSKSTTPESTVAAIQSVEGPILLIAGGADKGLPLRPMLSSIRDRVRQTALIGETATWLGDLLTEVDVLDHQQCGSLEAALDFLWEVSSPGDTILLSPGCASLDQFTSFEARGEVFQNGVRKLRKALHVQ